MSLLEKICKKLEIEVGDSWAGDAGKQYKINEYGQVRVWNEEYGEWIESYYNLGHVINGDLKPKWKPKEGELYYVPYIHSNKEKRYTVYTWDNDCKVARFHFENNLNFKTKEEAIETTNKILESLREVN